MSISKEVLERASKLGIELSEQDNGIKVTVTSIALDLVLPSAENLPVLLDSYEKAGRDCDAIRAAARQN